MKRQVEVTSNITLLPWQSQTTRVYEGSIVVSSDK